MTDEPIIFRYDPDDSDVTAAPLPEGTVVPIVDRDGNVICHVTIGPMHHPVTIDDSEWISCDWIGVGIAPPEVTP